MTAGFKCGRHSHANLWAMKAKTLSISMSCQSRQQGLDSNWSGVELLNSCSKIGAMDLTLEYTWCNLGCRMMELTSCLQLRLQYEWALLTLPVICGLFYFSRGLLANALAPAWTWQFNAIYFVDWSRVETRCLFWQASWVYNFCICVVSGDDFLPLCKKHWPERHGHLSPLFSRTWFGSTHLTWFTQIAMCCACTSPTTCPWPSHCLAMQRFRRSRRTWGFAAKWAPWSQTLQLLWPGCTEAILRIL